MNKNNQPPKILPPMDYVVRETVVIDGKAVRILAMERDVKWEHNRKPRYNK